MNGAMLSNHPFFGNRIGSIRDFKTNELRIAYSFLESYSDSYVDFMLKNNLYPEGYIWPIDALHNWSRIWESTYVFYQINKYVPFSPGGRPKIFDIGSALTFFPSVLASRGFDVTASDVDPMMEKATNTAKSCVDAPEGIKSISYVTCDCCHLETEKDNWYDAVTCISVLEHVPDWLDALNEIYCILKPGGKVFLTIDLQLGPLSMSFSPDEFYKFLEQYGDYFDTLEPEVHAHPIEILRESNHPRELTKRGKGLT